MQRVHLVFLAAPAIACGPIVPVLGAAEDSGSTTGSHDDGSDGADARPEDAEGDANPTADPSVGDDGNASVADEGSAETGMVGICGDGFIDVGELCDDGNNKPGDGCEPDCTPTPGLLLWSQSIDENGDDDSARAVAVTLEGDILVAGSMRTDHGDDLWIRVLANTGDVIEDDLVDLGDDETATGIAITPDGAQFVAGVKSGSGNGALVQRGAAGIVEVDGAPTDITAFNVLASRTAEGFVLVSHSGGFGNLTANVRRFDGAGMMLGDLPQPAGNFVGAAIPGADGGTLLGGGTFGGMGMPSTVWLAALAIDASPEWNSSIETDPDMNLRVRSLAITGDGRIVGVGTRGMGGPMGDEDGWIWWWTADGAPETDGPLDIGGASARPSVVVGGTHGLIVGGTTTALDDGFVAGLTIDGELQWGYELAGDTGLEDRVTGLALVPGVGVVAVGIVAYAGIGEDAWIGMFTE